MVPFAGAPCSVGGQAMQALLMHLGHKLSLRMVSDNGKILKGVHFKYERPHNSMLTGHKAVELLRDFNIL